jgi:hypothetical protein
MNTQKVLYSVFLIKFAFQNQLFITFENRKSHKIKI